eukprot:UN05189
MKSTLAFSLFLYIFYISPQFSMFLGDRFPIKNNV